MSHIGLQDPSRNAVAEGFETVHAEILRFFPELVCNLGGDPGTLLSRFGLDAAGVTNTGATYRQLIELLELAAAELCCPDFGMRLAVLQGGARVFGPLGQVMRNARRFGDALEYVCRHAYAHSLAAVIRLKWLPSQNAAFSGHDILLDRLTNKTQAIEQLLLVGNLGALELTGGRARARKVHFRHQPVSSLKTYRRYFGCEVLFGQNEDGLLFSGRSLACPIIDADSQAYAEAAAYVKATFTRYQPPLHAQVRGKISHLLASRQCTNAVVAGELKLLPRTLHRYLRAEGTSFHRIKDEVRRDLALYYLRQTDISVTAISEKLGFAEQAVLARRCNRWFAVSPTRLRQQGGGVAPSPDWGAAKRRSF